MATYDSLLLNFGGGIIPESQKANQYAGAAALAIGIGGTGCAALSELKAKVYQQIKPDDPKSPYPKYDHIQFLAIDSDATAIQRMRGVGKFENDEFFSIDQSNLRMAIGSPLGRKRIKEDPTLNWMEIDKLDCFFASPGTSAVRQIGRYLLISKAASLKAKIESICIRAMRGQNTPNLDVYIFAGLSGGTGSGCFLDVCYIVHNVLEQNGWAPSSHTFGFFFLPDVVTSKPEVASNAASVAYNNSNGYAAMKELDYLMNLGAANDWFEQNYGSFMVKTQAPPVDMCHLISGRRADGSMIEGAFSYAINVAADYVMTYLVEGGLPACGVLGVFALPKKFGSNRSYHVLGMCNAKIPTIQIATYLASCFYERFQNLVRYKFVKKAFLDDWVKKNKLDSDAILYSISEGTEQLILPNIDIKDLRSYGVLPKGRMVEPWAVPGNNWLDHMSGKRAQNKSALTRPLMSFRYEDAPEDSLLGRTFRRLYELSCDPSFGPYYAISMLNYAGQDLFAAIDGAIDTVREQKATAELQLHGDGKGYSLADQVVQSNERFIHKHNKRTYQEFLDTVKRYFMYVNEVNTLADTEAALQIFKQNLSNLYTVFFAPLYELLENLKETFRTNLQYLETPAATVPTADTWRILQLADIKEELDASVARLNTAEIVRNFAGFLLRGYDEWIKGDESRITKQISEFMEKTFQQQMDESLEEYLYRRFPEAGGDVNRLSQCVLDQVISTAF